MLGFGIYYTIALIQFFWDGEGGRIYIEQIILPFFPILLGSFSLYKALILEKVMEVKLVSGKKHVFGISAIEKNNRFPEMLHFLSTKTRVVD